MCLALFIYILSNLTSKKCMRKIVISLPSLWKRKLRHTKFISLNFMLLISGKVEIQTQQADSRICAVNLLLIYSLCWKRCKFLIGKLNTNANQPINSLKSHLISSLQGEGKENMKQPGQTREPTKFAYLVTTQMQTKALYSHWDLKDN